MTTTLEIVDSAVTIGLGALISGVETYLVTVRNHTHDRSKAAQEDKRELLRNIAKTLEEASSAVNSTTYSYERYLETRPSSEKELIGALNKIGEAKSLAILTGHRDLFKAIAELRAIVQAMAAYHLRAGEHYVHKEAKVYIENLNGSWPTVYAALDRAYASTHSDA